MISSTARAAALFVAVGVAAACSSPSAPSTAAPSSEASPSVASSPVPTTGGRPPGLPTPQHVLVVVFENHALDSVLGSPDAPYLTALAASGTTLTDAHGVRHPSQPNYLALFSGSTQGVSGDSCPHSFSTPNLGSQLLAAGRTFAGYSEGLPAAGAADCTAGEYARKHNPWVDFPALPAAVNQPLSALPTDFATLPTVSFVIPNMCSDMHDCSVATGDTWAEENLAAFVAWGRTHDSLLVVTFDEDDNSSDNHIATFLVGPMVRAGTSTQRTDHYRVLRTIEAMYGLPPLGAAGGTTPLAGIWTIGP
ncbi:MAG: phosphatidylinositol-3-phosphatase [Blastococcus sp.]|nr:phosphatidylinositol-3-phosphatase [Blastococcus sp.]